MRDGVRVASDSGGAGAGRPSAIHWAKYPRAAADAHARAWLHLVELRGRDPKTIDAYARGVDAWLAFLARSGTDPLAVTEEHVAHYLHYLRALPGTEGTSVLRLESGAGLMNATMQLRLTAVRLWYDDLVRRRLVASQPAPRGTYSRQTGRGTAGVLRRQRKLPWVPTDAEWLAFLQAARCEPLRNRVMIALAYEGALRREEVVQLELGDIDVALRLITLRPEITKNLRGRVVTYSATTSAGLMVPFYQALAPVLRAGDGARAESRLFRSHSTRNPGHPISLSAWNKTVTRIAQRAGVPQISTHTFRHRYLTELARAGWDLAEIAAYAGHRDPQTTLIYIHLSGRELQGKIARTTARLEREVARLGAAASAPSGPA